MENERHSAMSTEIGRRLYQNRRKENELGGADRMKNTGGRLEEAELGVIWIDSEICK